MTEQSEIALGTHLEFLGKLAEVCEKTSEMERVSTGRPFEPLRWPATEPRLELATLRQAAHAAEKLLSGARKETDDEMSELVLEVRAVRAVSDCDRAKLVCKPGTQRALCRSFCCSFLANWCSWTGPTKHVGCMLNHSAMECMQLTALSTGQPKRHRPIHQFAR